MNAEGVSILLILVAINVYFIPTYVAYGRKHHNRTAIFLLNLFIGWTFLGWLGALIWSATSVKESLTEKTTNNQQKPTNTKQCPFCAETIKSEALVCRFCGNELTANSIESNN